MEDPLTSDGFVLEEEAPEPAPGSVADFVFGEEYRARFARHRRGEHRERMRLLRLGRLQAEGTPAP